MGITSLQSESQPSPGRDEDWYEEIGTEEEKEMVEDSDMYFFMN